MSEAGECLVQPLRKGAFATAATDAHRAPASAPGTMPGRSIPQQQHLQQPSVPTLLHALSECESSEPQLIVEAASPCKILLANPAWCALTGYSSEDVVGNSVSLLCDRSVRRRPPAG